MEIHPQASVHPSARIGEGTIVGPGVVVGAEVEIGTGCEIRAHAVIDGHTRIGERNRIGYGAVIGAEPQDLSYKGQISRTVIGDDNNIREYVTIHRGTAEDSETVIGSQCYLMAGSHVGHNCRLADHVILVNNVLLGGYVEVGAAAFLGGAVVVHQYTRIGAGSMTRGQTRLGMDVPPFCMAVATNTVCGLNRVGMKRRGIVPETRRRIAEAYKVIFQSGLNRQQAIETLQTWDGVGMREIAMMTEFLRGSRRGICRHRSAAEVGVME